MSFKDATITIYGYVFDSNNDPLGKCNVLAEGKYSTLTRNDGYYELVVPQAEVIYKIEFFSDRAGFRNVVHNYPGTADTTLIVGCGTWVNMAIPATPDAQPNYRCI